MKNCDFDTKGHIISYETDNGNRITDYKALAKAMGLDQKSDSSTSTSSGGYSSSCISEGLLWFICIGTIIGCSVILLIVAWLFFKTAIAVALTVIVGLGILFGIIYLLRDSLEAIAGIFNLEVLFWVVIIAIPLALIIFPIISWINWSLTASVVLTVISVLGLGIYTFVFFKYIWI